MKEEIIQARWMALQSAFPYGFKQIWGKDKHKVAKINNKTKKKIERQRCPTALNPN
jgi:hypothetical protein